MSDHRVVRPERSTLHYSRGAELARAIRKLWEANARLPPGQNATINARIEALLAEFDLTLDEWYHWSDALRSPYD